jgi:ElaB/YqjD/DUF883 family membrane-anchored ribosome-binding protein
MSLLNGIEYDYTHSDTQWRRHVAACCITLKRHKEKFMSIQSPSNQTESSIDSMRAATGSAATISANAERHNGLGYHAASRLRDDLQNMKQEFDALFSNIITMSETELQEAHAKLMAKFSSLRYAAKGVAAQASQQLNHSVDVTSGYVKDKPLQSVAIAAGTGLLLGVIFGRR